MTILMAASEASPFAKTGGLADVMEQLPKALAVNTGYDVNLVIPYYKSIKDNNDIQVDFVCSFFMPFHGKETYVGLLRLREPQNGVTVYFIDNNDYFYRDHLYGYYDDGERFAYFSKGILECLSTGVISADIIHCNDWQTALIPLLLHGVYKDNLSNIRTVLTIHNLEYQGWAGEDFFDVVLGIPHENYPQALMFQQTNFLLAGIEEADRVTTVSETYSQEILTDEVGGVLAEAIRRNQNKLIGIVNGFEEKGSTAERENHRNRQEKALAKEELQKLIGLPVDSDAVLLGMVTRLTGHKGIGIICDSIPEILQNKKVQLVICGTGDDSYEKQLKQMEIDFPNRMYAHLKFDKRFAELLYQACDIYLMPSLREPCGLSQIIAMKNGAVPVVRAVGGLRDTVKPIHEKNIPANSGYGFLFYQPKDFKRALTAAVHMYYDDTQQWSYLSETNRTRDFSWNASTKQYLKLYRELLNANSL